MLGNTAAGRSPSVITWGLAGVTPGVTKPSICLMLWICYSLERLSAFLAQSLILMNSVTPANLIKQTLKYPAKFSIIIWNSKLPVIVLENKQRHFLPGCGEMTKWREHLSSMSLCEFGPHMAAS